MTYKTILVHLDCSSRSNERLDLGFSLAASQDAHLVGYFALSATQIPGYVRAAAGPIIEETERHLRKESAESVEAAFRAAMARNPGVKTEWRVSLGDALDPVRLSARCADLVVLGQRPPAEEDDSGLAPDFIPGLLLSAGRPLLIVPNAGRYPSVGKRALVAWNGGREAARAVVDALPLLRHSESVQVVVFESGKGGGDHGEVAGADISLYLARHGVKVTAAQQQRSAGVDIGAQILSRAADLDADLLVMGGYGHSRWREFLMGGATRTVLESMTLPVLMSH
jgi:nucleotide-binding universal stress UspA family protein